MFRDCIYWIGAVENEVDPQKRGRVQVRIFGAHDTYNEHITDYQGRTEWQGKYSNSGSYSSSSTGTNKGGTAQTVGSAAKGTSGSTTAEARKSGNSLIMAQRNNNPLNWGGAGTIDADGYKRRGGEYRFDDMNDAVRQYVKQINNYQYKWTIGNTGAGGTTCNKSARQIWNTWAPPSDGNKDTKQNVEKWCAKNGIDPDSPLDTSDPNTMASLLSGIMVTESGIQCSSADILTAMNGGYAESLTAQSTLLQDGVLYVGASNATTPGASSNTGQNIRYGTQWQYASQEQYDTSQANAKSKTAGTGSTSSSSSSSSSSTNSSSSNSSSNSKDTTPGALGKTAQTTDTSNNTVSQSSGTVSQSAAYEADPSCHKLPTADLPWAFVLYPASDYGGTSYSTLPAPQVQKGAWVFGVSIDGAFMNQLFILGVIPNTINVDSLSTNPNESSTKPITNNNNSNYSSGSTSPTVASSNMKTNSNSNVTYDKLFDGVWNAESSRSKNKKTSSAYCYGAMQLMPALAAGYVLNGAGSAEMEAAGLTLTDDMKASLSKITNVWGSKIVPYLEDENVAAFCDLLTENDAFNKAIGNAYLNDCMTSSRGNGDPCLSLLYYMQGETNARNIMGALGYNSNEIPSTVSYSEFADQVTTYIQEHGQKNNFSTYIKNVFEGMGGVDTVEAGRSA